METFDRVAFYTDFVTVGAEIQIRSSIGKKNRTISVRSGNGMNTLMRLNNGCPLKTLKKGETRQ